MHAQKKKSDFGFPSLTFSLYIEFESNIIVSSKQFLCMFYVALIYMYIGKIKCYRPQRKIYLP